MNKEILSVPQAAKFCAMSRGSMWKYVKSGELPASLTPGGQFRILKTDLESFAHRKGMYPLAGYESEKKKILIVDDDTHVQKMLSTILPSHKYEIAVASDGFEAGIKVMGFKPNLVILDLFMEGVDGFEVCRRIKEHSGNYQIKVLAITGYDTEENRARIMEAGADDYLSKPLRMALIIQHIENLLKMQNGHIQGSDSTGFVEVLPQG